MTFAIAGLQSFLHLTKRKKLPLITGTVVSHL
jgi:hypothetical protein